MTYSADPKILAKIKRLTELGQGHILKYWPELEDKGRQTLLQEIADLSIQDVEELIDLQQKNNRPGNSEPVLEPTAALSLDERVDLDKKMYALGQQALRRGQVGAFLVAGGQGSSLGFDGPKGMFPITPVKHKSFFQLFAEKIRRLQIKYETTIPWYIMTSKSNHEATTAYFKENEYFGLKPEQVAFFM